MQVLNVVRISITSELDEDAFKWKLLLQLVLSSFLSDAHIL